MTSLIPIAPDIFAEGSLSDPAGPQLLAGRHRESGRLVFPCPATGGEAAYEPYMLARRGTLWSFTIQRFQPKSPPYAGPEAFEPYAVGYVELPGEIIVESRLTGIPFDQLRIGMPVRLTTQILDFASGEQRIGFAFTADEHRDEQ